MNQWDDLVPAIGTRSALIGHTGCGKSTLAEHILRSLGKRQDIVVIDIKGKFDLEGAEEIADPTTELASTTSRRLIYKPDIDSDVHKDVNYILRACFRRGNIVIYIDDIYGLKRKGIYPESLEAVYTMGRQLDITMLVAMQRPTLVPLYTMTEAETIYCFTLSWEKDRQRVASVMQTKELPPLPEKYQFHHIDTDKGIPFNGPNRIIER